MNYFLSSWLKTARHANRGKQCVNMYLLEEKRHLQLKYLSYLVGRIDRERNHPANIRIRDVGAGWAEWANCPFTFVLSVLKKRRSAASQNAL